MGCAWEVFVYGTALNKNKLYIWAWSAMTRTWLNEVSLRVWGPRSIMAWRGSSTANMPLTLRSPKYRREASSRPSCHISCHKMATLISSSLTWMKRKTQKKGLDRCFAFASPSVEVKDTTHKHAFRGIVLLSRDKYHWISLLPSWPAELKCCNVHTCSSGSC